MGRMNLMTFAGFKPGQEGFQGFKAEGKFEQGNAQFGFAGTDRQTHHLPGDGREGRENSVFFGVSADQTDFHVSPACTSSENPRDIGVRCVHAQHGKRLRLPHVHLQGARGVFDAPVATGPAVHDGAAFESFSDASTGLLRQQGMERRNLAANFDGDHAYAGVRRGFRNVQNRDRRVLFDD